MAVDEETSVASVCEAIERTGRTVVFAGEVVDIRHDAAQVHYIDTILENFAMNGIVHIGLGSLILDPGNKAAVDVAVRLRMSTTAAQNIVHALKTAIDATLNPPDKSKAN